MNGMEHKLASVETLAQIVVTGAPVLPVTASVEELALLDATKTATKAKDLEPTYMANLAQAFHCSRAARRDERNGFTNTAAMEWRTAAELFAPNTRAVEYCWREWERIMHLPRRLAGPVGALAEGL